MEKRTVHQSGKRNSATGNEQQQTQVKKVAARKTSEYGRQLLEKQKVKHMYGMLERQFRRFFEIAAHQEGSAGDNLLSMLERRLDNVVYRLKLATTRSQARQVVVHGHVLVNGRKVHSPSYQVNIGDVITVSPTTLNKQTFVETVIDKRLSLAVKVPDWIELNKEARKGTILRLPVRSDIQAPIEDSLIVELYSK